MTEATNTRLMDTEPGGEQTQYEGAQVFQNQIPRASKSEKQGASQSGTYLSYCSLAHEFYFHYTVSLVMEVRAMKSLTRHFPEHQSRYFLCTIALDI